MRKKSFIQYVATELRNEYNIKVTVLNTEIEANKLNNMIKNSIGNTTEITLISRYMNELLFSMFDSSASYINSYMDHTVMMVYNGYMTSFNKNVIVKELLKIDGDPNCKICFKLFRNAYARRSCTRCKKSFCVKCQISIMISIAFKKPDIAFKCPYCNLDYDRSGYNSPEVFLQDIMEKRFIQELDKGVLSKRDILDLTQSIASQLDDEYPDSNSVDGGDDYTVDTDSWSTCSTNSR
jgi:hypothetical protein